MSKNQEINQELCVYRTSNGVMLGTKDKNIITGIAIRDSGMVRTENFADYLKAKLRDEFMEVQLGANDTVSVRKLKHMEKVEYASIVMKFEEAKRTSENWVIENVFDEMLGK